MSSTALRLFSRSSSRLSVVRSPRVALTRRMMSSELHASHSSDKPWIIGSALVFGPLFLYLVSPSARQDHHAHVDHEHQSRGGEHQGNHLQQVESHQQEDAVPIADDEGTEASAQEVKESMEKAFEADVPGDTQERKEAVAMTETTSVADSSASESHSETEAATTPVSEPESSSTPVEVDLATQATGEAQGTTALEPTTESKVRGRVAKG